MILRVCGRSISKRALAIRSFLKFSHRQRLELTSHFVSLTSLGECIRMKKRMFLSLLLANCAFFGGGMAVRFASHLESPAIAQAPAGGEITSGSDLFRIAERFELVAQKVAPAVVYVEASKPPRTGGSKTNAIEESGSGVLVRAEGNPGIFVLTNNHVIAQSAAEQITINLADGRLFRPTRVWADPETDVAVLRLEAGNLPVAALGDSDNTRVGQWVLAIGSPFGLNQTVTHGIISARERGQVSLGSTIRIKDFLQTDAAINPGSSGGPLLNLNGEVIGINTAIASQSGNNSGVAFSIPINLVKRVMKQLLEKGNVARGYLGMQLASSFEPADAFKVGLDRVQGAWVEAVYPGTPAAAAGLSANDVVLKVDDITIRNENHLINFVSTLAAGQKIRLQVWRDRKMVTLEAVIGDWAQGQGRFKGGKS
jgi:S1-C subfamily serine protease